jgi:pimeloyl-ACP methyl ester carboxylesterase
VITWDARGHGESDSPDDPGKYSHALAVDDMAAVLDFYDIETAAVGGLSLGGYLSLAFYARHPGRVDRLLLFDTGPGYKRDESRAQWNANAEAVARNYESRGLDALSTSAEARRGKHNPLGLAHAARGLLAQQDDTVIRLLPDITVPTLVLVGADDQPFLAAADYMAKVIPRARKVVIPDAGHAANIDQPQLFNEAVTEFLG